MPCHPNVNHWLSLNLGCLLIKVQQIIILLKNRGRFFFCAVAVDGNEGSWKKIAEVFV